MTEENLQPERPAPIISRPTRLPTTADLNRSANEVSATAEMLRTQVDQINWLPRLLGFGRRVLVPADEIHAVVGDGLHSLMLSNQREIFGKSAERSSFYWLNPLTQVIKLKTISFTVPIRGYNEQGVQALDNSKVSFQLWAHAVAKLNPEKADVAAQRVGVDTTSLLNTITKVGMAELVAAAATMPLVEIISNRQRLAEIAFPKVNQILAELGYDLALLTVTELGGEAYLRLVEQAEARVYKETSIATNLEQIAEIKDRQARERTEAEIRAETEKKLAAERLAAERVVNESTLNQQETLDIRRHEVELRQVDRKKSTAQASHDANLLGVQLAQKLAEADAANQAELAKLRAEREAELRALEQKRTAALSLAETETEAERQALAQMREIARAAERTEAEAKRLRSEELARAERAKEIALLQTSQAAESLKLEAEAQANALQVQTDAETKVELVKAEAEATATEKRAQAAKIRAEATRAETAAAGLAEAEVEAARVRVAEQRVAVTRAEGLADAEIKREQATAEVERLQKLKAVEINAQRELVQLYNEAPVLVEIEKLKMHLAHKERITQLQVESYLRAFEALAPSLKVQVYGNGGQTGKIITDIMGLAQGLRSLGEEVPAVSRLVDGVVDGVVDGALAGESSLASALNLGAFLPYIQQIARDVNPRMLSTLKVADLVTELGNVVSGQSDLVTALHQLRQDGSFRVIGDLPVLPFLQLLGIGSEQDGVVNGAVNEVPVSTTVS
jgi:uncharacterized membrane protein YqiK